MADLDTVTIVFEHDKVTMAFAEAEDGDLYANSVGGTVQTLHVQPPAARPRRQPVYWVKLGLAAEDTVCLVENEGIDYLTGSVDDLGATMVRVDPPMLEEAPMRKVTVRGTDMIEVADVVVKLTQEGALDYLFGLPT